MSVPTPSARHLLHQNRLLRQELPRSRRLRKSQTWTLTPRRQFQGGALRLDFLLQQCDDIRAIGINKLEKRLGAVGEGCVAWVEQSGAVGDALAVR